jgi:hypothetical protein
VKFHTLFLVLTILILNCPKKYAPKVEKIEVIYLSSLYEDIQREEPYLAGLKGVSGIKIGHLVTEPPCMARLLGRLGFYQLLDEFPLDFIICDTTLYDVHYMSILESMGYGITNYSGIRFAMLSKDKDSLKIEDEITLTLVRQRSDVLWIIDKSMISSPPQKIDFFIKARALIDTSTSAISAVPDTSLYEKVAHFRDMLNKTLSKKIYLEGERLDEHVLSKVALHNNVNIILYPDGLFLDREIEDSISVRQLLEKVSCEMRFRKSRRMTETGIEELSEEKGYEIWGEIKELNMVSFPDAQGLVLFDILYPSMVSTNE